MATLDQVLHSWLSGNSQHTKPDVGYNGDYITQTPTISTGIYASGDAIGGLLTFANASESGGRITIESIVIIDKDSEKASLDLVLFDRTFTPTSDNSAFDPTDADLANCVGHVAITSGDYSQFNDNSIATVRNVGLSLELNGTSLFGQLVTRGTPTYTATSDLTVKLYISEN